ncbi:hypothetical protein [Microbacterium sp. SS28]|uniref:hypothetical protein n=1 Tax=Microbacterium sp. SS28 TaxID=2919948 RepID=UPI001FAA4D82|nr:hypothetical protein [Microbacterium sp. SS28]
MTDQPDPERTAALRTLLVETATRAPAQRRDDSVVGKRAALAVAALSVGAVVLVVALQSAPGGTQDAVPTPTEPAGDSVTGPSTGMGSRVKLYTSLQELIADSGAVVSGVVTAEQMGEDGATVFTLDVERSFTPEVLGSTSPEPAVPVAEGTVVHVRTFGGMTSSVPSATLQVGDRYLLFLTPTGLNGAAADEFFITGMVAGIYFSADDHYARMVDDGDDLPAELRDSDLE